MTPLPFCSVIVPCRNEIRTIDACLQSLLTNDYPRERLEVLIVDGGSTDGTRDALARYAARYSFIRVLDNPNGVIPVSMNLGIRESRGSVILKADAHTMYPPDYVSRCVRRLEESGAANVGGVIDIRSSDDTPVGRSIARVLKHPFGRGNSRFRIGVSEPTEVDTVAWGCYRRSVLEEAGGYDERLVRSSDVDLNGRIRTRGGRILLFPDIVSQYCYHHSTLRSFMVRNLVDGYWVTYPIRLGGAGFRLRHVAPVTALLVLLGVLLAALVQPLATWALAVLVAGYAGGLAIAGTQIGWRERSGAVALATPAVIAGQHVAYALGSLWGLVKPVSVRHVPPRVPAEMPVEGAAAVAQRRALREAGLITVVVPALNEARRLPAALRAIETYLRDAGAWYEVIVVDDGSTDGTSELVEALMPESPNLRLIRFPENRGKGAAIQAGMLAGAGRALVFTDADQSTSIDQLPGLLDALGHGFDVAMGSRGLADSRFEARQRWYRRKLGDAFGLLARLLLVRGFRDCQCGFKAFTRQAARQIFTRVTSPTAIFDVEVVLLSARLGMRVAEVPVTWKHDPDSRLVYNVRRAIGVFAELLRLRRHWRVLVPPRAAVTSVFDRRDTRVMPVAFRATRTGAL